ncbi:sphingomyelin phosphodiesterase 5-like isoform X1 [Falco biarmicus]|uniref:sphingomyelin phosphodiesterase 5-like isoform X1 n=2 Tax=Falco cherrug TaxID=345164 RepID=UPI002478D22E|nr:sphingomyelin phosphodiesterase 5-like isoform X1 [Falco cherrug]XP_056189093.1 sphingomyelin phosphodiesterase 5-like isoform X1 [Falco biarmicus]
MAPSTAGQGGRAGCTRAPTQERGDVVLPLNPLPSHPVPTNTPHMLLRESPFPSRVLVALDRLARWLLTPSSWAVFSLLDLRQTTEERRQARLQRCGRCHSCTRQGLAGSVYVMLLLLSLPLAALGLLLWLPVQAVRRPFAYQYTAGTASVQPWDLRQRRTFTFLSANVCLMPSGLAKFSNLGQTPQRAVYIARHLTQVPPDPPSARAGLVKPRQGEVNSYGGTLSTPWQPPGSAAVVAVAAEPMPAVLSEHFPADADFICLQEVFDGRATTCLRQQLGSIFPHIVSEVGALGLWGRRLKLLNSGLFLASRYPLLAVRYHGFPNGAREDALAAKGLLVVQVLLGSVQGQRVVGYIGCTHLQAPAADAAIRDEQLTLGLHWLQLFREEQEQRGDVVAFDIFCGDLNFDNCSRGDELNQQHQLFKVYQDPCRRGPGQDAPWGIGTLLNYLKIYDEPVSTPEKLKRTLSQPSGRHQYLAGPILSSGEPDPAAPGPWQGRRLDYILYRPHHRDLPLQTEVAGFSVITQLATRSDHLPVVLRLNVAPATP